MATPEIRKFDGLYLQANSFNVPDGAMEMAENVVIQADNVVSKTKGFFEYWRPGGADTVTGIKALYTFQGKLIGAFSNGIGHYNDTFPFSDPYNSVGVLVTNAGDASSFERYAQFAKANSNLYITGESGIFRLEAFDSPVRKAGVAPALSMQITKTQYVDVGILPPDSQTAYRAVFGRRDTNGNLLLSSPSDVETVGMPSMQGAPIPSAPLVGTLAYTITSGVVEFADPTGVLANHIGEKLFVLNATNSVLNGSHTVNQPFTPANKSFTTGAANGTGFLSYVVYGTPTVTAIIPSEINQLSEEYFVQFYRTPASLGVAVDPTPTFFLVTEIPLTQAQLSAGQVSYTDVVDPALFGAELYTDENSREGELQANLRPPQANVISDYKGYMLYSDITTVQRLNLDVANGAQLSAVDVVFTNGVATETYRNLTNQQTVLVTGSGTGTIVIADSNNTLSVGDQILITNITGTLPIGKYTTIAVAFPTYTISAPGFTMTDATVEVVRRLGKYVFHVPTSGTPAQVSAAAAKSLVRAINLNSGFMYANYKSSFSEFPGKIAIQSKAISDPIYVRLGSAISPQPFIQPVPASFGAGVQIYSENDVLKNATYISKQGEPEAVPLLNRLFSGESSGRVLNTIPLRDCVIIIKEDGAFKLTGDVLSDFSITPLDTTVRFDGRSSRIASEINNVAIGMSNQGVVQVTENGVQVISRRIDDVIQPLVGRDLSSTFVGGNEGDRLFYVNTSGINAGDDDVCWVYNILNQSWTKTTEVFTHLALGPNDETLGILYDLEAGSDVIHRQRKTQTLVDYTGKYVVGTLSVEASKLFGSFVITGGNPVSPTIGDAILYDGVFSRVTKVVAGGGGFTLSFSQPTNIPTTGTPTVTLYKAYKSTFKMAPFHAGQVGLEKHFSQMQMHLRQAAITDVTITFGGAYFGSSEITKWSLANISSEGSTGWGYSPWGFFPWGLSQGIKLSAGTRAASIIRTYVPRFAARNTFIQAQFQHNVAGQPMLVQALVFVCRGYGSRVSR